MDRHFTATAYVVMGDAALLHWHAKLRMWLPPGGHVEPDEDPVQAVLREVLEETGVQVEILPTLPSLAGFDAPTQLPPPVTILVEDIPDPANPHQHIDLIYFTRPVDGQEATLNGSWRWVSAAELKRAAIDGVDGGGLAEDVRLLGLKAIEHARRD